MYYEESRELLPPYGTDFRGGNKWSDVRQAVALEVIKAVDAGQ